MQNMTHYSHFWNTKGIVSIHHQEGKTSGEHLSIHIEKNT
ncbi:hypothetical protein NC653_016389 [Populus alba x Populus x berolinensis]|uniref:Uncharacterized protein n=1 Tax=Populus alba x Populus x berolinensis TaxID=444605 RepID=A0AAD6QMM1_9ROSI|nr:hypothetical protein NC653_016389 [Populus alba x Populus x berolinensis]